MYHHLHGNLHKVRPYLFPFSFSSSFVSCSEVNLYMFDSFNWREKKTGYGGTSHLICTLTCKLDFAQVGWTNIGPVAAGPAGPVPTAL